MKSSTSSLIIVAVSKEIKARFNWENSIASTREKSKSYFNYYKMTTLLSNFVAKVQNKHWQNLRRKTQKLEPSEKEDLLELLEENLAATKTPETTNHNNDDNDDEFFEEDYELLQRDLDKAYVRLEELQSKHDFLQTRLETYCTKIQRAQERLEEIPVEERTTMASKIESYKISLQPVEETFLTIARELNSTQSKIDSMQDRQLELKLKTQECKVVLEELCFGMEEGLKIVGQDEEILASVDADEPKEKAIEEDFRDDEDKSKIDDVEKILGTNKDEDEEDVEEKEEQE